MILLTHLETRKKKKNSAHALWLDQERGELFCRACDDYIYDASFDSCALGAAAAAWHLRGGARARPSSALAPPPLREAAEVERDEQENIAAAAAGLPSMMIDEDDEEDGGIDEELLRSIPRRPTTPSTAAALGAATDADAALAAALSSSSSTSAASTSTITNEPAAAVAVPEDGMPPGLRGLANLGNTCYVSSVLQALVHAPPLRDFFLSGGHCRHACADERSAAAAADAAAAAAAARAAPAPPAPPPGTAVPLLNFGRGSTPPPPSANGAAAAALGALPPCLPCELSSVVAGAYSGERSPIKPSALLAAWWHVSGLSGAQQQDAHEFYLGALQTLDNCKMPMPLPRPATAGASSSGAAPPPPRTPRLGRGAPISRAAFGGLLRSDVTCCGCGFTSTAHDPFLDISIDVSRPRPPARVAGGGVSSARRAAAAAAAAAAAEKADKAAAAAAASAVASEASPSDKSSPTASPSPAPAPDADDEDKRPAHSLLLQSSSSLFHNPYPGQGARGRRGIRATRASMRRRCGACPPCLRPGSKKACLDPLVLAEAAGKETGTGTAAITTARGGSSSSAEVGGFEEAAAASGKEKQQKLTSSSLSPPPAARTSAEASAAAALALAAPAPAPLSSSSSLSKSKCLDAFTASKRALSRACAIPSRPPGAVSLLGCLRRFVAPERLEPGRWRCDGCGSDAPGATKQMSIRRLPPVLCLHVKRFEGASSSGYGCGGGGSGGGSGGGGGGGGAQAHRSGRKLDTPLLFPAFLDLSPFMSASVFAARMGNLPGGVLAAGADANGGGGGGSAAAARATAAATSSHCCGAAVAGGAAKAADAALSAAALARMIGAPLNGSGSGGKAAPWPSTPARPTTATAAAAAETKRAKRSAPSKDPAPHPSPPPIPPYELYAVVSHSGSLTGGHYVSFVRAGGRWYSADDGAVTPSDEASARSAQPYMLFYRAVGGAGGGVLFGSRGGEEDEEEEEGGMEE